MGNIKFDHKIPRFAVAVYAKKQGNNYLFNLADTGIAADKIKDVKDISNTKIGETANLPAGVKFSAAKAQLQVPGEKMESFDLVSLQQPEIQENRPNSAKLVYQVAQHKTAAAAERGNSGKAPAGGKKTADLYNRFPACCRHCRGLLYFLVSDKEKQKITV